MRRKPQWIAIAAALAALVAVVGLAISTAGTAAATPPGDRKVIVQLFQWRWTDVARECTQVLGPKGFGGVQVSPPQEHVVLPTAGAGGYPWWQDYQPVSYRLDSRRGNEQEFKSMIDTCHAAGVKIYADAVVNHMTGQAGGGTGSAGTTFPDKYTYPGLYSSQDFHDCRVPITDYTDRTQVQTCELVSLADLKTESDYVQGKLAEYLNKLLGMGVDGFRVDGVKHIAATDMVALKNRLDRNAYIYQEVIPGAGEPITQAEYLGSGDVTEFKTGQKVSEMFLNDNGTRIRYLLNDFGESWGFLPSDRALSFVDNHDTQRNALSGERILSYRNGSLYRLANVFQLAHPYGTPVLMSSFAFTNKDAGPPRTGDGTTAGVNCDGTAWVCEHRWPELAGMVGFRNAVGTAALGDTWVGTDNQIAFGRGDRGYVVINRDSAAVSRTFQTSLPAGTYCDVVHGDFDTGSGTCAGPVVRVGPDGAFTASVAAMNSLALHVGARVTGASPTASPTATPTDPAGQVAVAFGVNATTSWGQNVFVVGSVPGLGGWDPANAVPLSSADYPVWRATVSLPASTAIAYKYIKKNPDGSVTWESDPNRTFTTAPTGTVTRTDTWR